MHTLGIIPEERLQFMPRGTIPRHEFCFWLHDEVTRLLLEATQSGYLELWHTSLQEAIKNGGRDPADEAVWEKLAEAGGIVATPIKLDVLTAILSDTLHFIYESLIAFEKRKFNVAYSLLRKPLTENLIILCKLAKNDDDFIKSFADGTLQLKQVTNLNNKDRVSLFDDVIDKLHYKDFISGDLLNDIIFSRDTPNGLQRPMQQATHLITTRHESLCTPKFGLNKVFHFDQGDENYNVYDSLPVVMFFILQISIALFWKYFPLSPVSLNEILVRSIGLYGNIYEGRLDALSRALNKSLSSMIKCEWCEAGKPKIKKRYAASFYLNDQIHCGNCGRFSHTPLTYLLRSGALNIAFDGKESNYPDAATMFAAFK